MREDYHIPRSVIRANVAGHLFGASTLAVIGFAPGAAGAETSTASWRQPMPVLAAYHRDDGGLVR